MATPRKTYQRPDFTVKTVDAASFAGVYALKQQPGSQLIPRG